MNKAVSAGQVDDRVHIRAGGGSGIEVADAQVPVEVVAGVELESTGGGGVVGDGEDELLVAGAILRVEHPQIGSTGLKGVETATTGVDDAVAGGDGIVPAGRTGVNAGIHVHLGEDGETGVAVGFTIHGGASCRAEVGDGGSEFRFDEVEYLCPGGICILDFSAIHGIDGYVPEHVHHQEVGQSAHRFHLSHTLALGGPFRCVPEDVQDLVTDADHVGQIAPVAVQQGIVLVIGM